MFILISLINFSHLVSVHIAIFFKKIKIQKEIGKKIKGIKKENKELK